MSSPTGQRPGGLTALAVLNFIFGGLYALGFLGMLALLGLANEISGGEVTRQMPNKALVYLNLLLIAVTGTLLIASGVGYLKQKNFLGKTLGNVYGVLGLIETGIHVANTGEFQIVNIINLVYPVLTLALLNTVFKDDFPNP